MRFEIPRLLVPRPHNAAAAAAAEEEEEVEGGSGSTLGGGTAITVSLAGLVSPIKDGYSPSHRRAAVIDIEGATVAYTDATGAGLDRDFVVVAEVEAATASRAVVEAPGAGSTVAAAWVDFRPPAVFETTNVSRTEIIFVIDRSGSMNGRSIEQARLALLLFLRSLPAECKFNVVGFGSTFQCLFPAAVTYTDANVSVAVAHALEMQADLGGTDLLAPLQVGLARPCRAHRVSAR